MWCLYGVGCRCICVCLCGDVRLGGELVCDDYRGFCVVWWFVFVVVGFY